MVLEGLVEINGNPSTTEEQGASREGAMLIGGYMHGKGLTVLRRGPAVAGSGWVRLQRWLKPHPENSPPQCEGRTVSSCERQEEGWISALVNM